MSLPAFLFTLPPHLAVDLKGFGFDLSHLSGEQRVHQREYVTERGRDKGIITGTHGLPEG